MSRPGDGQAERNLWVAVVERALMDATGILSGLPRPVGAVHQERAAHWIRKSRHFLIACDLAGLPGELIRARFIAGTLNTATLGNAPAGRGRPKKAA